MITCSKCGGETEEVIRKRKSDGKPFKMYQCVGTCVSNENSKWKHTQFPPRENGGSKTDKERATSESVELLRSIDGSLKVIVAYCTVKDKEIPF